MLEKLKGSSIAWAILSIIAILSFLYAIICQQRNREKKEFSYCLKSNYLIRKRKRKFNKLFVTYGGKQIEDLCISKFTIWNSGNKTLNHADMVESRELTIFVLNDSEILEAEIICCSEETNRFVLEIVDNHTVKIRFDYVDKKEGVVIQVMHTGESDIQISCKIKGGKQIKQTDNIKTENIIYRALNSRLYEKLIMSFIIVFFILLLGIFLFCILLILSGDLRNELHSLGVLSTTTLTGADTVKIVILLVVSLFSIGTLAGVYMPLYKRYFKIGIPQKLKKYSDFENEI